jgi:hypothetical protein
LFYRGGNGISHKQENEKDVGGFICPNASCRKIFIHPLKASNLGLSAEPYDACPYCLTEIDSDADSVVMDLPKDETPSKEDMQSQNAVVINLTECKKHFGYLSERAAKEQIPDECLTCREIVHCMLRTKEEVGNS